jgi:hypothetical protein
MEVTRMAKMVARDITAQWKKNLMVIMVIMMLKQKNQTKKKLMIIVHTHISSEGEL